MADTSVDEEVTIIAPTDEETSDMPSDDMSIEDELLEDLGRELSHTDELYDSEILIVKIRSAIREVKTIRNYPDSYTSEMIDRDLYRFYSNIRNIALYDYNMIGNEWQISDGENGKSRSYEAREKLFKGVIPLTKQI